MKFVTAFNPTRAAVSLVRVTRAAVLLVLVIFGAHYAPSYLASTYPDPAVATRAWFYVAQALKGCVLFLLIALVAPRKSYSIPVWAACAWGFFEDSQVAICRVAQGMGSPPPHVEIWQGLCGGSWFLYSLLVGLVATSAVAYGVKRDSTP
ncbi:MAG: hypothetical protein YHS30scaffold667_27 [Phage 65_10]|nr:MAG: hypothetical protein YHS30scaffold667_27 [Phage 65_10]